MVRPRLRVMALAAVAYFVWAAAGYPLTTRVSGQTHDVSDGPLLSSMVFPQGDANLAIRVALDLSRTFANDPRVDALAQRIVDPWPKAVVLDYLFFTANTAERTAAQQFVSDFHLAAPQVVAIQQIALESRAQKAALVRPTMAQILDVGTRADERFRAVVGSQYGTMRTWLRNWYSTNSAMRLQQQLDQLAKKRTARVAPNPIASLFGSVAVAADFTEAQVYATQVGVPGWDVALPDWALKCATLGLSGCPANYQPGTAHPPPYFTTVTYNGKTLSPYVKEVGPWNENDNYWDSVVSYAYNPRRCNPSPGTQWDGVPESELAILINFNEGMSCELKNGGYQAVGNQGGIDLDDDLRAAFGICYLCNVWVQVTYYALP
jgi:hypothetical protein